MTQVLDCEFDCRITYGYPGLKSKVEVECLVGVLKVEKSRIGVSRGGHSRCLCWNIWSHRNGTLFRCPIPKKAVFWDNIVTHLYWISDRCCKRKINWVGWLQNPMHASSIL